MKNTDLDLRAINDIIRKITEEIGSSRNSIVNIVDNIRSEQESLKNELNVIKGQIFDTINEVDHLEKYDKQMRQRLAEVSKNFTIYTEKDIKAAYEEAENTRIRFITKRNEEKELLKRRSSVELALRKAMENIKNAEQVVNQISIALRYLEGDILSVLEDADKNSEMFLGIKILEAQENERKRIARDVHDGPAQHMANTIMKVDICKMVIQKDLDKGLGELEDLKESVKVALKEVRNIIFDLRPMTLDDLGLNETIQETIKSITHETKIKVDLRLKPIQVDIEPIIQVAVYRIVQEIFNNIRKHAMAKNVEVKLDFGTKYLMLVVTDDGVGFDVEGTFKKVKTKGTSYGLIGILDRVNQLQGEIKIKSSNGSGTSYSVKLPINREVIRDEKRGD
ncbi:sensor histidine kinase [Alkalicella caledoniensis]|uniref:Oxygen sensor histidine kinase NreB n=1 Tax=Alkalicella caledoniensis TaxID=2731377 RepID=A0A7G9W7E3_ALKCA|nr:sensor histidine kinase [Alkalicella caledoniensis]QNO14605.1 sensor histidine kinase [Alkalicella caledoniensis]